MSKPWMEFRIAIGKKKYATVIITGTVQEMNAVDIAQRRTMRLTDKSNARKGFIARSYLLDTGNEVAIVLFCKKWHGGGVVAHEMAHVALHYFTLLGIHPKQLSDREIEEKFCTLVDHLVRHHWINFYKQLKEKKK